MYAPHAELDAQFRGRLKLLRERAHDFESQVSFKDPDAWEPETVLGAFQACLMLKDALDAAGPLLLKRTHAVIAREAGLAGQAVETLAEERARRRRIPPRSLPSPAKRKKIARKRRERRR
jgi:hypothetical protein